MKTLPVPSFTGATLYNDPDHLYSFWYPTDWYYMELNATTHHVAVSPNPSSLSTSFSIEIHDLVTPSDPNDMDVLREGILEGLNQLDNCHLIAEKAFREEHRFGHELLYTFTFGKETRKRRSILYCCNHWQYSLICQGATEHDFDYWLPMWNFIIATSSATSFDLRSWLASKSVAENG